MTIPGSDVAAGITFLPGTFVITNRYSASGRWINEKS